MRRYQQMDATQRREVQALLARALAARPEIVLAFLVGSFLTEPQFHDVDVAVWLGAADAGSDVECHLEAELAADLAGIIRLPVDLVILNHAVVALRYHAARGEPLLCRDAEIRDRFLLATWKEYYDFEPFLRKTLQDLLS